jgi:hypothetical protein
MPSCARRRPMTRLRAVARAAFFDNRSWSVGWILCGVTTLAWPFFAAIETVRGLRATAAADRPKSTMGWLQRAGHMMVLALRENVSPAEYVVYRLHLPLRQRWAGDYLYAGEERLCQVLNRRRGADPEDVQDKARFADICRNHGLPAIPTLAVFENGQQRQPTNPFRPEHTALFVKDLRGWRGAGQAVWQRGHGFYTNQTLQRLTESQLIMALRRRDCIIQPVQTNHPDLAPLSVGGLVDFRILSGIDPEGRVTILSCHAVLPWKVTGTTRRYCRTGIDLTTGRLHDPPAGNFPGCERHPVSQRLIREVVVPYWSRCVELVTRAHAVAFSRFVFLGWDVAITAEGPILIETNVGWGARAHQLIDDKPIGHTDFADIATRHLQKMPCRNG